MLVLSGDNSYNFANMTIKVTDNTYLTDDSTANPNEVPEVNILIPTVQDVGKTNVLELFYPGELNTYIKAHGYPNALKYGFGPDMIYKILESGVNMGVYTINLRDTSAVMANSIIVMKWKVEKDVPYTDMNGAQYYLTPDGKITTSPSAGEAIKRDVMHVKFLASTLATCKKRTDLLGAMDALYSETPDDKGFCTMPIFAITYAGASKFGNNCYMGFTPKLAEYDGNMYYGVTAFDGVDTTSTGVNMSLDIDSGAQYNTSYFIETMFNAAFSNLSMIAYTNLDKMYALVNPYMFTLKEYQEGTWQTPARTFNNVDIFGANEFAFVTDLEESDPSNPEGIINMQAKNAIQLKSGADGAKTANECYEAFFNEDLVPEVAISSALRHRISYIVDVGYNDATKKNIIKLVRKRNRMTVATLMIGGDTFESAITEHQAAYFDNDPCIRILPKCQSALAQNEFTRRMIKTPATYFDLMAMIDHINKYSNFYQPFAGADARWSGYVEETMMYPPEKEEIVQALYASRINTIMKDSQVGGYLSDQQMNTTLTSDQTEFNNAFLISNMLYDLLALVHRNHFKFNEAEEVRVFTQAVDDCINTKYAPYSASVRAEVWRAGTVGRAKSKNMIRVTIDLKDINKYADVEIVLTDE